MKTLPKRQGCPQVRAEQRNGNGKTIMAEQKHGTMDVRAQEKTFEGFVKFSIWIAGISIAAVIFMAVFNS